MNERIDLNAPRVVFRKWSDYFVGSDEEEEDDDDGMEFDDEPGHILLKSFHAGPFPQVGDVSKLFNLYVCSTNFIITKQMFNELNNLPGLESLDALSPYKLRVGFAELFNENEVRLEIAKTLKQCLESS